MASKDFIYDLLDKLEHERTEYVLFTFTRSGENEQDGAGELYYNLYKEDSKKDASRILANLSKAVLEINEDDDNINIEIKDDNDDE